MKTAKTILLCLVAVLLVLVAARNVVVKREVRRILERETGFGLALDRVDVALLRTAFDVRGVTLSNPEDFPERDFFDVRQVVVDYDLLSLFGDEVRLREVVLDVPKVVVVKKADGETNLQRLSGSSRKERGKPAGGPAPDGPGESGKTGAGKDFRIDRLVVRIGTVEIHDYTVKGGAPGITTLPLNVDQEHRNVTSVAQIGSLMAVGVAQQVGARFLGDLLQGAQGEKAEQEFKKVTESIGKAFESFLGGRKK